MLQPTLTIIVAYANNRGIGYQNQLPWRLPQDLAHFKKTTQGHPIIMGRKTWESLGRPLPNRKNIVITRNQDWSANGAFVAHSIDEAVLLCDDTQTAFIIGGAEIYALALNYAQTVIATEVDTIVLADAFFPALTADDWVCSERSLPTHENGLSYSFVTYQRKPPQP